MHVEAEEMQTVAFVLWGVPYSSHALCCMAVLCIHVNKAKRVQHFLGEHGS